MRRPCLTNTTYLSTYLNISATCHESLPPSSSSSTTTTGSSSSSSSRDLYIIAIFHGIQIPSTVLRDRVHLPTTRFLSTTYHPLPVNQSPKDLGVQVIAFFFVSVSTSNCPPLIRLLNATQNIRQTLKPSSLKKSCYRSTAKLGHF